MTGEVRRAALPALPETREEIMAVAKELSADPAHDVFLGPQASRRTVIRLNDAGELAKRRVVMFATHGLAPGNLPDLRQPALALAYAKGESGDWLLTLEDVLKLKLDADWVVLSACNTAAADGRSGEALSGLGRGFFYAGARSVLVTHWAVETQSAKDITSGAFSAYANGRISRAEALRSAQLALIAKPRTSHPALWAPFVLVGDGAR
jgi:CHAT domain-containing protein